MPAPIDGVLSRIIKKDGDSVTSGEVIAVIDSEAKATAAPTQSPVVPVKTGSQPEAKAPAPASAPAAASPSATKIAAEKGIDPSTVPGTGRDGRVTKADVVGASAPAAAKPAPLSRFPPAAAPKQRVPMSRLRQRIAERLLQSQSTAAILTTFNEVNMAPVMELRARYKDKFEKEHGVKLGFMSFFVKAVVHALRKYPIVNASIDGTDVVYHGYYDIGIAVGSERGLVVPILRDADLLSIADIEKRIADFGKRAKDGKITLEELTGGTFSISNGGVFGSMLSTPIINPPQSAILGVHATKERPSSRTGRW